MSARDAACTSMAEALLKATAVLGEVTDELLDGKITREGITKVAAAAEALAGLHPIMVQAYVFSGAAGDDFLKDARRSIAEYREHTA